MASLLYLVNQGQDQHKDWDWDMDQDPASRGILLLHTYISSCVLLTTRGSLTCKENRSFFFLFPSIGARIERFRFFSNAHGRDMRGTRSFWGARPRQWRVGVR